MRDRYRCKIKECNARICTEGIEEASLEAGIFLLCEKKDGNWIKGKEVRFGFIPVEMDEKYSRIGPY